MKPSRSAVPILLLAVLALAACVPSGPQMPVAPAPDMAGLLSPETAAENFIAVVDQVEPVAERYCRQMARVSNCDFQIAIDSRPGQAPNAFQTVDDAGRPILAFTLSLIRDARNRDELAFVLGHEAAHHIAGHLTRQRNTAMAGAVLAGIFAQVSGGGDQTVSAAQDFGANIGARRYSKDFELEADSLGAEIALVAGYDPRKGAAFFDRLPDPGNQFLGTHPANADRKRVIEQTMARLGG